jgi:hypothetical protein
MMMNYLRTNFSKNPLDVCEKFERELNEIVNNMVVYHGQIMLETIGQYNVLANYLIDFQITLIILILLKGNKFLFNYYLGILIICLKSANVI